MKNGEKSVFCTNDVQHGVYHGGNNDVVDVYHDPTVTKTKSRHFMMVAFATRGMAVAIPYKRETVKMVEALLPTSPFFLSHESSNYDLVSKSL